MPALRQHVPNAVSSSPSPGNPVATAGKRGGGIKKAKILRAPLKNPQWACPPSRPPPLLSAIGRPSGLSAALPARRGRAAAAAGGASVGAGRAEAAGGERSGRRRRRSVMGA
ncbi:unnamed protein product [Coccothraustes coccothraustes]